MQNHVVNTGYFFYTRAEKFNFIAKKACFLRDLF
jgi:hypothetical protein